MIAIGFQIRYVQSQLNVKNNIMLEYILKIQLSKLIYWYCEKKKSLKNNLSILRIMAQRVYIVMFTDVEREVAATTHWNDRSEISLRS